MFIPKVPKRDWKVGDVRGIQEVVITQPIAANLFSFKYLLAYFVLAAISGISFLNMQRRQAVRIKGMNQELEISERLSGGTFHENFPLHFPSGLQEHF